MTGEKESFVSLNIYPSVSSQNDHWAYDRNPRLRNYLLIKNGGERMAK